jgi:hypothetical protein
LSIKIPFQRAQALGSIVKIGWALTERLSRKSIFFLEISLFVCFHVDHIHKIIVNALVNWSKRICYCFVDITVEQTRNTRNFGFHLSPLHFLNSKNQTNTGPLFASEVLNIFFLLSMSTKYWKYWFYTLKIKKNVWCIRKKTFYLQFCMKTPEGIEFTGWIQNPKKNYWNTKSINQK